MSNRLGQAVANWRSRHQNPTSFWLHMVGIPACFVASPILLILRQWATAGWLFAAGYALQFLGHVIEGNRSGEEMLLRRLLGGRRAKPSAPSEAPGTYDKRPQADR